jgi:diguanylate cyclase (GGDEF)-like protein
MPDPRSPSQRPDTGPPTEPRSPTKWVDSERTVSESLAALELSPRGKGGDAELIVLAHPDPKMIGSRFRVPRRPRVAVGRAESADLHLAGSPALSRHHATFHFADDAAMIEDAGSRNGTFVNGRRIEGKVELASGDRIQLGGVHCKFLHGLDVEAAYHDALLELATRDGLTGAYNRRFFEEELEREFARSRTHGYGLALVLLDLDSFKRVNDQHGHVIGDQVLRELVMVARTSLGGEPPVLARVGGEEFAFLCRESGAEEARALAERMRAAMATHPLECLGGAERVTCSFGVAELVAEDAAALDLYRRADGALYRSKNGGRDRVTVADASERGAPA